MGTTDTTLDFGMHDVAGDKSISHRIALLSVLAGGPFVCRSFLLSDDTKASLRVARTLGVTVSFEVNTSDAASASRVERDPLATGVYAPRVDLRFEPPNPSRNTDSRAPLAFHCSGSGTTARLLLGLLSGLGVHAQVSGNAQLSLRPMGRVTVPLREMGASFSSPEDVPDDGRLPLWVDATHGHKIHCGLYRTKLPSAQVKSAMILAALHAASSENHVSTTIVAPKNTRDHTERLLSAFGAPIRPCLSQKDHGPNSGANRVGAGTSEEDVFVVAPLSEPLAIHDHTVMADPSSASFLAALVACLPGTQITIPNVGLNPTRTGFFGFLKKVGVNIKQSCERTEIGEPVADLTFVSTGARAADVGSNDVKLSIDEMPLVALVQAAALGSADVSGASELRVKECDRIHATVTELAKLGVDITENEDGWSVGDWPTSHFDTPPNLDAHDDHRIAMMLRIATLVGEISGRLRCAEPASTWPIRGAERTVDSFPGFDDVVSKIRAVVQTNAGKALHAEATVEIR